MYPRRRWAHGATMGHLRNRSGLTSNGIRNNVVEKKPRSCRPVYEGHVNPLLEPFASVSCLQIQREGTKRRGKNDASNRLNLKSKVILLCVGNAGYSTAPRSKNYLEDQRIPLKLNASLNRIGRNSMGRRCRDGWHTKRQS